MYVFLIKNRRVEGKEGEEDLAMSHSCTSSFTDGLSGVNGDRAMTGFNHLEKKRGGREGRVLES